MAAQLSSSCVISKLPAAYNTHTSLISSANADIRATLHATNNDLNDHLHHHHHQYMDESCSLESHSGQPQQPQPEIVDDQQQSFDCHNHQNPNQNPIQDPYHLIHENYPANCGLAKGASSLLMLNVEEYESKSSSDNPDECEQELVGRPTKKRYHRHSQHQIQEMERVFKECPHPDEKQRMELSRDLKLDPRQVKFWFQNKRTQVKAQHERHDNTYLRTENEKLRAENLALRDAMANVSCPNCGGPATLTDVSFDEQQLRIENVRLREEIDRISKIAAKHVGRPISTMNLSSTLPSPTSTTNSTIHLPNEAQCGNTSNGVDNEACNNQQSPLPIAHRPIRLLDCEKPIVVEHAMEALQELVQVVQAKEPLWVLDPLTNLETIDHQQYFHKFSRTAFLNKNPNMRRESTRETTLIMMDSSSLVELLMNVATWADMFSCIVSTTLLIETLSPGTSNDHDGAMQLMYAEFQLPTPLVPTREVYFIRHAKHMTNAQGLPMWVVVDVSIDNVPRTSFSYSHLVRYRKRPSGCVIEDLPNGYSKVTWVEHFEYLDEYKGVHHLFEQLVSSGMAFGAQRWLSTLHRRCESMQAINKTITSSTKDIVSPTLEGRKSLLKLAERMTNSFCVGVNASITHTWITLSSSGNSTNMSSPKDGSSQQLRLVNKVTGDALINYDGSDEVHGVGEDVRVLIRKSVDDPGRPPGVVLCATTSIWLPIPPSHVFHFLQDQNSRVEWDILSNMGVVEEIMHVPKGHDNNNNVSLLRVNAASSNQPNMLILQECCAEESSYVVVYAPVDIAAMSSVINGGDPDCVALLPSGFSIFPDGSNYGHPAAQYLGAPRPPAGSLLTIAFQILVDHVPTAKLSLGSVATVNNLISSTVLRIKNALTRDTTCMH